MSYLSEAFHMVCKEAKQPERWYVCLIGSRQCYGGPEEGGWWYTKKYLEAYQECVSEQTAHELAKQVEEFAKELDEQSLTEYGNLCLSQMDWLDQRGLDADFLPENDGPTKYEVRVRDELPEFDNTKPYYS